MVVLIVLSTIWYRPNVKHVQRSLRSKQGKFLLSVSGAYRTTSDYKLYNILDVLPLDLEIQMFLEKQNIKKTAPNTKTYKEKLNELYTRRLLDESGQIDFKINVNIECSTFIKLLTPEIVQLLTGHGCFW